MKNALLGLFIVCTTALGQAGSTNAAGDAIQKRVQGINLLSGRRPKYPTAYVLPPNPPKLCAIPLLLVPGPGTKDEIPVIIPKNEPFSGDYVQVPAPACP